MSGRASLAVAFLAACLGAASDSSAAPPREVRLVGARVHVGDVVQGADAAVAGVDLGPSPVAGCSRIVTRADILAALGARQLPVPPARPDAVRVVRQAKRVAASEVNALVRDAVKTKSLRRGVTLDAVRAERAIDVIDGWSRVDVDLPRPPKKAGPFATVAVLSFFGADAEVLARVPVPVELGVSTDGTAFDAARGTPVTLIIRRPLVEVRVGAFAGADADVGDAVPIQLRPSGRVIRARLLSRDEALATEDER
jgi:hypothetical protein